MKAIVLILLVLAAPLSVLPQGKVMVINDGASLIVLSTDTSRLKAADAALAGQPVGNDTPLPSGVILMAGLYAGTSSSQLFYYPPVYPNRGLLNNPGAAAGTIGPFQVLLTANATGAPNIPGIASGTAIGSTTPWFQVKIWDSSFAYYETALAAGAYCAAGPLFQLNPGPSLTYTFTAPPGPNSTWTDGPIILHAPWNPSPWIYITSRPASQTVVQGGRAAFGVWAYSIMPLHYQWYFNGAPLDGANSESYVIAAAQPANEGTYSVTVFNDFMSAFGGSATLTVLVPPHLTSVPVSQTAEEGATVGFSASATGDRPLTYQWFFNAANVISSATTNPVVQITNVDLAQAGAYNVVVSNVAGAVTSSPAMLAVIPPVPRRLVPGLTLMGQSGSELNLDHTDIAAPAPNWTNFVTVLLTNAAQWYFDLANPLPRERFYRTWTANPLNPPMAMDLHMIPALILTGAVGSSVRVDGIDQVGPVDAWVTLDTVTLTNTPQFYFDTSVVGHRPRLWRLVPVP